MTFIVGELLSVPGVERMLAAAAEFFLRLLGIHAVRWDYIPAYATAAILLGAMLLREELRSVAARAQRAGRSRRRHSGRGVPLARRELAGV